MAIQLNKARSRLDWLTKATYGRLLGEYGRSVGYVSIGCALVGIHAAIYYNALKLRWVGLPVHHELGYVHST